LGKGNGKGRRRIGKERGEGAERRGDTQAVVGEGEEGKGEVCNRNFNIF